MSWCTQWKGTPQDCIDHIRKKHHVGDSVPTASLGKWSPPWTVTRAAWNAVLKPKVSGISTDTALFSEHGAQLVHHYWVFGNCVVHASLRGPFILDLLYFTNWGHADAHCAAKRSRNSGPGPIHHQINQFRCLGMFSNARRMTTLRFAKPLGLSPRSCWMIRPRLL